VRWGRRKEPAGRSVPAVVVDYGRGRTSGETPPESWKSTLRIEAVVQVEGDDRRQPVSARVPGRVMWMMAEGDVIPVLVDDAGTVVDLDRPAIEQLYAGRKDELRESLRPHSVVNDLRRSVGLDREQLDDIGPALRDLASVPRALVDAIRSPTDAPAPSADPAPPIDGVAFSTFVAVQAALVRDKVPAARHDEVAQAHGVPAGTWAQVQEAWMTTVRSDPAVAQAFGAAYAAAIKG